MRKLLAGLLFVVTGACFLLAAITASQVFASYKDSEDSFYMEMAAYPLVFGLLFLVTLVAHAFAGFYNFNAEQTAHGEGTYTFGRWLVSSQFGVEVMENWQSEFLQFTSFIFLAIWLKQRGSNESKPMNEPAIPTDKASKVRSGALPTSPLWAKVGGWRTWVFSNSLLLVMLFFWLGTWAAQTVTGWTAYNDEQSSHSDGAISLLNYVTTAEFWDRNLQNWQSEFLAVATMAIFTVYLRQHGSPESKPVGEPHLGGTGASD